MREARIILPMQNRAVHAALQAKLVSQFGGFTMAPVSGAWRAPDGRQVKDVSMAYDVACEPTEETGRTLTAMALQAGHDAGQRTVYLRLPNGDVRLLDCANVASIHDAA